MADVEVVYVTELEASGFLNGVINMAFSTYQFIPQYVPDDGGGNKLVIAPAPMITANLRFDLRLAQIMRDRLNVLIEENTKMVPPKASN